MLLNRERALAVMEELDLDALVATQAENVYYLSDYFTEHLYHFGPGGFAGAILPRDEQLPATLILQEWELPQLTKRPTWMPQLRVLTGFDVYAPDEASLGPTETALLEMVREGRKTGSPNRQRALGATLQELGLANGRLGFDEASTRNELSENELADATLVDAVNVFRRIRSVKTPDEVTLLRHAAKINQTALEGVRNIVDVGVTPRELMRYYRSAMAEQGGYGSHMTGGGGAHPWLSHPDMSYEFKRGDVIYLDPAGHYRRYWADVGRAAIVGEATAKFEERNGRLQDCHREVVPMITAGASSTAITDAAARSVADHMPGGFVPLIHSIGLEHYDQPQSLGTFLSEDFTIEEGMVVNFETLYFELGWGLLQFENTYVVGSGEPERVQTLPMEPFVCPTAP
ncbi:MAG: M24 family metallopeptidase [Solirubrobacteraceae bacterium]